MSRKRGAPVLIELLKNRSTRVERPVAHEVPVRHTPSVDVEPKPRSFAAGFPGARSQNFWFLVAAAIALISIVSIAAYMLGTNKGESDATRKLIGQPDAPRMDQIQPPPIAPDPLGGGDTPKQGNVKPTPVLPVVPQPAKSLPRLKTPNGDFEIVFDNPDAGPSPGLNYLAVGTLYEKDAKDACEYLSRKGVPCFLWPETRKDASGKPVKVDPNVPAAKNGRWVVYVLKGAERPFSSEFRPTKDALERLIMDLGARWKQENRLAPTKFDQPLWVKWTNN